MLPDNFLLFIGMTTLVSMAPGPNVMFIMSQAALRGHRAGMMAGFGIQVALEISAPGVPAAQLQELVDKAHIVCPYSNATRGNIDVTLSLAA